MTYYTCPRCNGREFIRLEVIAIDSKGFAIPGGVKSSGIFRCNGCNSRFSIDQDTGTIVAVTVSAKRTVADKSVRSAVTGDREPDERRRF